MSLLAIKKKRKPLMAKAKDQKWVARGAYTRYLEVYDRSLNEVLFPVKPQSTEVKKTLQRQATYDQSLLDDFVMYLKDNAEMRKARQQNSTIDQQQKVQNANTYFESIEKKVLMKTTDNESKHTLEIASNRKSPRDMTTGSDQPYLDSV